jgi:hypothetical protein
MSLGTYIERENTNGLNENIRVILSIDDIVFSDIVGHYKVNAINAANKN